MPSESSESSFVGAAVTEPVLEPVLEALLAPVRDGESFPVLDGVLLPEADLSLSSLGFGLPVFDASGGEGESGSASQYYFS